MDLTPIERERITDTMLQVESAQASFEHVDHGKVPNGNHIEDCLETAHQSLRQALGYTRTPRNAGPPRQ